MSRVDGAGPIRVGAFLVECDSQRSIRGLRSNRPLGGIGDCIILHLQAGEQVEGAVHAEGHGVAGAPRPDRCGIRRPDRYQLLPGRLLVFQTIIVALICLLAEDFAGLLKIEVGNMVRSLHDKLGAEGNSKDSRMHEAASDAAGPPVDGEHSGR